MENQYFVSRARKAGLASKGKTSPAKAASSAANGKLGGRPKGSKGSPAECTRCGKIRSLPLGETLCKYCFKASSWNGRAYGKL